MLELCLGMQVYGITNNISYALSMLLVKYHRRCQISLPIVQSSLLIGIDSYYVKWLATLLEVLFSTSSKYDDQSNTQRGLGLS